MPDNYRQILSGYLPENAVDIVYGWIKKNGIFLRISRSRRSKFGDYRPPQRGNNTHRISVNHDLNPYAFLITLTHEMAHQQVWEKYGRKARPHGIEWKEEFRALMLPLFEENIFPEMLQKPLMNYMENLKATNTADTVLSRILMQYDPESQLSLLEELPEGTTFIFDGSKRFVKGDRLRKRFKCQSIDNGKTYLFSPVARVQTDASGME